MKKDHLALHNMIKRDFEDELLHGVKVANLAFLLAKKVGFSYERSKELAIAGLLHDLGKLQMSPQLYGRDENALDVEELVRRRSHAKISYDILMRYDYSDFILKSILYHHENYDGSGYPYNLSGDSIPLGARIIRVCDVYSALTTNRPYRKSFDKKEAIELMIEDIKDFDLQVFLAFQRVLHDQEEQMPTLPMLEF